MNLSIYEIMPFGDEDALKDFVLANALSHSLIDKVLGVKGKFVMGFPLQDISDPQTWLQNHYLMHVSEFEQIGLNGLPDISVVDFENEGQFRDWMKLHSDVHAAENTALGIV